jgi:sporulation protein YlmC with PRC-barrel domain
MKTSMNWIIYGVSLSLFTGTCLAYGSSNTKEPTSSANASASATQHGYMGFFDAKSLIGTEIMNDQKQELGGLKDVVFNPQNGETFAAIGIAHDRCALVPWQALKIDKNPFGKEEITLNTTKQALDSGPAVKSNDWQELNQRSFAQSIYQHYNLQAPTPVGGVSHGALGSHSSTSSGKSNNSKS